MNNHPTKYRTLAAFTIALIVSAPLTESSAETSNTRAMFSLSPEKLNLHGNNTDNETSAEASLSSGTASPTASATATPSAQASATASISPSPSATASASSEAPSPTSEAPSPTSEAPSPTSEAPSPTSEAPSPTSEAPSPTSEAPSPTSEAPSPSNEAPSPSEAPSSPAPAPSSSQTAEPEPSEPAKTPTADPSSPSIESPSPSASPEEKDLSKISLKANTQRNKPGDTITAELTGLPEKYSAEAKLINEYTLAENKIETSCQVTSTGDNSYKISCQTPQDLPQGAYRIQAQLLDEKGQAVVQDGWQVSYTSERIIIADAQEDYSPSLTPNFQISAAGNTMQISGEGYTPGSTVEVFTPLDSNSYKSGISFAQDLKTLKAGSSKITLTADSQGRISTYIVFSPYMQSAVVPVAAHDPKTGITLQENITVLGTSIAELSLSSQETSADQRTLISIEGNYFAPYFEDYPVELQLVDSSGQILASTSLPIKTSANNPLQMGSFKGVNLKLPKNFTAGSYTVRAVVPNTDAVPEAYRGRELASSSFRLTDPNVAPTLNPSPLPSVTSSPENLPTGSASPSTSAEPSETASPQADQSAEPTTSTSPSESPAPSETAIPSESPSTAVPTETASPTARPSEPAPQTSETPTYSLLEAVSEKASELEKAEEATFVATNSATSPSPSPTPSPLDQAPVWLQTSSIAPTDKRATQEENQSLKSSVLSALGAKDASSTGANQGNPFSQFGNSQSGQETDKAEASSIIVAAAENKIPVVPIVLLILTALGIGGVAGAAIMRTRNTRS